MSTEDNQFNFFSKDMSINDNMKIEAFYRNASEGYNEIILNTAMMLFNWVMGLNTLAIGLTTAVMSNYVATKLLSFNAKWVFISSSHFTLLAHHWHMLQVTWRKNVFFKEEKLLRKDLMSLKITK